MSREIAVDGHQALKETLTQLGNGRRIFILFSGAKDQQGHSWCPDCVLAEKPVENAVKSALPDNAVFIDCSVGDRPTWKDPKCAFRTDPQLRLSNVPTLIEWGTGKRLVEGQLADEEMIKILFEED